MSTKFVYVTNMGELYKLTPLQYRKVLWDLARGKDLHRILPPSKYLGVVVKLTDMTAEEAKTTLDEL